MKFLKLLVILPVLLVGFLVNTNKSYAQDTRPESFHAGSSKNEWTNITQGVADVFHVDVPYVANGEVWQRFVQMTSQNTFEWAQFGVEVCGGGACNFCRTYGAGAWVFLYATNGSHAYCSSIRNDLKNTYRDFAIWEDPTNDAILLYQIVGGPADQPCSSLPCSIVYQSISWGYNSIDEYISATFKQGEHRVFGSISGPFQYRMNNTWINETVDGTFRVVSNPPQMGWEIEPQYYSGGALWQCDYDTGTFDSNPGCVADH